MQKLFLDLKSFEPTTSESAVQHPNHYTTEAFNRAVSLSNMTQAIGVKYCICKHWLSTYHYCIIIYADYDLSNAQPT